MATYVLGDIHGRFDVLERLLDNLRFDPAADTLWFVGDLVNNGDQNVEVLRFVRDLGADTVVTLGNHDLHMLAVACGQAKQRRKDTFDDVLEAPDRDELLDWLRHRSMAHFAHDTLMIHAGVLPGWSVEETLTLAHEIEERLRAPDHADFFAQMYGNEPNQDGPRVQGIDRLRLGVNTLTRMRVCTLGGALEFKYKGELAGIPEGHAAWFRAPRLNPLEAKRVVFGHWSAIGYIREPPYHALDSGCTWDRSLTALRLEDEAVYQVSAHRNL